MNTNKQPPAPQILVIIFIILSITGYAQVPNNLQPKVHNNAINYNSIFLSPDASTGWMCGDFGQIVKKDRWSNYWQVQNKARNNTDGINSRFNKIFFADDTYGWVAGDEGIILCTRDGGKTWNEAETVPNKQNVNNIFFTPDHQYGIAACEKAMLWISQDAGKNWIALNNIQQQEEHALLGAFIFNNGKNICVYGKYATMLYSEDGGENFKESRIKGTNLKKAKDHIYDVKFNDDYTKGYASCEAGIMLFTRDSGKSWSGTTVPDYNFKNFVSVWFDSNMTCGYAITERGVLYKKETINADWKPIQSFTSQVNFRSVQFTSNGKIGWLCGSNGAIFNSEDNGKTWQYIKLDSASVAPQIFTDITGAAWDKDYKKILLVTKDGNAYMSSDSCQSWEKINIQGKNNSFTCVIFNTNDNYFYIGGRNETILRTKGTNSELMHVPVKGSNINKMIIGRTNTLIAVGSKGKVLFQQNGGWKELPGTTGNIDLTDIVYINSNGNFLITGSYGIYKWNQQDGTTLQPLKSPIENQSIRSICFDARGKKGFIVTGSRKQESHLYYSNDAGENWREDEHFPENDGLKSVRFSDNDNEAFVTDIHGNIYRTNDAGKNWFKIKPQVAFQSLNVILPYKNDILFMGNGGAFVKGERKNKRPIELPINITNNRPTDSMTISINKDSLREYFSSEGTFIIQTDHIKASADDKYKYFSTVLNDSTDLKPWPKSAFPTHATIRFSMKMGDGWNIWEKEIPVLNNDPLIITFWHSFTSQSTATITGIIVGVFSAIFILISALISYISPAKFLGWNEKTKILNAIVPKAWSTWLPFLLIRKKVLNAFARQCLPDINKIFEENIETQANGIYVHPHVMLNGEIVHATNIYQELLLLSEIKDRTIITLTGEGGTGKSALALQIVKWATTINPDTEATNLNILPIYINKVDNNLDQIIEEKILDLERYPSSQTLIVKSLMRKKKILVIVDGVSEMKISNQDFISPEKGAKNNYLIIFTGRNTLHVGPDMRITTLSSQPSVPDFISSYNKAIERPLLDIYSKTGEDTPIIIIKLAHDYFASRSTDMYNSTQALSYIFDNYIECLLGKEDDKAGIIKQLRLLAYAIHPYTKSTGTSKRVTSADNEKSAYTIAFDLIKKLIPLIDPVTFKNIGILKISGDIDDVQITFIIRRLADYLAAKEAYIRYRDNRLSQSEYDHLLTPDNKIPDSLFIEFLTFFRQRIE